MTVEIRPRATALLVLAPLLLLAPQTAEARDCAAGARHYVRQLELLARGKGRLRLDAFRCLGLARHDRTTRWIGPVAARTLARLKSSRYRARISLACLRIIGWGEIRSSRACVRLLADHGVRRVEKLDTFALARRLFPHGMSPIHLAALGDPRAVAPLMTRYSATRVCRLDRRDGRSGLRCSDFSPRALKRSRLRRRAHRAHRINVLNALWHLAHPSSRKFLQRISRREPDKKVRHRAARALMQVLQRSKKRGG